MASSCRSILRIGGADELSAHVLQTAVTDFFDQRLECNFELFQGQSNSQSVPPQTSGLDKDEHCITESLTASKTSPEAVCINNRYFSAHVHFRPIEHVAAADEKEDGIVLVWNSTTSMDTLSPIHDRAVDNGAGDLLRLCVYLNSTSPSREVVSEQAYADRVLFCLDRGYEYVSVNLNETQVGHNDRDKEGFARVVEALETTMWSSAVMAKTTQRRLQTSLDQTRDSVVGSFPDTKENHTDPTSVDESSYSAYEPPNPDLLTPLAVRDDPEGAEREDRAKQSLLSTIPAFSATAKQHTGETNFVAEKTMNDLENALQDAARIREISQKGAMSDAERRQRAGDAALILMNLMGQFDDSEEEDDNSSNCEL
jgi:hypothetical protein